MSRFFVCEYCLQAIESHEGEQFHKKIGYWDLEDMPEGTIKEDEETGDEVMICDFCEELTLIDEMYEIL